MASRTSAGSSAQRSRLSFSPPCEGVATRQTPPASSTTFFVQPQGVYVTFVVIGRLLPESEKRGRPM